MGVLDVLTTGSAPPLATGTTFTSTQYPDWYTDITRGIAARGAGNAALPWQPYPNEQVAGFSPDQQTAFGLTRSNVNSWAPWMSGAGGALGAAGQFAQQAGTAGTNTMFWPSNWQQYMSPYTSGVVDEIARLGTRNMTENLLPAVNSSFMGSGQFGSRLNAETVARTMRDVGADILGQQRQALESGYGTAANIFGADANRALSGANTALGAAGALNTLGGTMGDLASRQQTLGANDASALGGIGALQQALLQKQLDTDKATWTEGRDWDWTQLGRLTGLLGGMQQPTTTSQISSQPTGEGSPSPLGWLTMLFGLNQADKATTPKP